MMGARQVAQEALFYEFSLEGHVPAGPPSLHLRLSQQLPKASTAAQSRVLQQNRSNIDILRAVISMSALARLVPESTLAERSARAETGRKNVFGGFPDDTARH